MFSYVRNKQIHILVAIILILLSTNIFHVRVIAADNASTLENDTFFVLGMLNEYISRHYYEGSDYVESFYWGEKLHAYVMVVYLHNIIRELNLADDIEIKRRQDLLVYLYSKEIADYLNSFYCFEPTSTFSVIDGKWKKQWVANFSYSEFDNHHRTAKLAYLAGAYYRFGKDSTYEFANGHERAKVIARLLEDVGCPEPETWSVKHGAPFQYFVEFTPTDELKQWFKKFPGYWAIEAADTIFGFASEDELEIYRKLIAALQNNEIDGYSITVPCVVMRITGIRGDGDRKMTGLEPDWEMVLDDFNERRTKYMSLIELASDSIIIEHDYRNVTELSRITFLQIGFNENTNRALTFLSNKRGIYSFFFELIEGGWKLSLYDVDESWRGVVFKKRNK